MPSSEQRIHAWTLLGILTLLMAGAICGLLWVVLAFSGDLVGGGVARIGAVASASLLVLIGLGQMAWLSYSRIRTP